MRDEGVGGELRGPGGRPAHDVLLGQLRVGAELLQHHAPLVIQVHIASDPPTLLR